jgi:hypothetical protein
VQRRRPAGVDPRLEQVLRPRIADRQAPEVVVRRNRGHRVEGLLRSRVALVLAPQPLGVAGEALVEPDVLPGAHRAAHTSARPGARPAAARPRPILLSRSHSDPRAPGRARRDCAEARCPRGVASPPRIRVLRPHERAGRRRVDEGRCRQGRPRADGGGCATWADRVTTTFAASVFTRFYLCLVASVFLAAPDVLAADDKEQRARPCSGLPLPPGIAGDGSPVPTIAQREPRAAEAERGTAPVALAYVPVPLLSGGRVAGMVRYARHSIRTLPTLVFVPGVSPGFALRRAAWRAAWPGHPAKGLPRGDLDGEHWATLAPKKSGSELTVVALHAHAPSRSPRGAEPNGWIA